MSRLIKSVACFVVCLLLPAMLLAQSVVTVTAGAFTEVVSQSGDLTTFYFAGVDSAGVLYMFTGIPGDPPLGFYNCEFAGCTLQTIQQIGKSVPFQIGVGQGSMWSVPNADGTTQVYCWNQGSAPFTYKSGFSQSVNKTTGILTAKGVLAPSGSAFEPGLPDGQGDCQPSAMLPLLVMNGTWQYAAQFRKSGTLWYLTQQVVTPVP